LVLSLFRGPSPALPDARTVAACLGVPVLCALFLTAIPHTPARAASCGGLNRPPCALKDAPRPCQAGLVVIGGHCKRPRKDAVRTLTCGGRNRSPCDKPPVCDRGLVVLRGKCVKPTEVE
jgi:hypothetical protein